MIVAVRRWGGRQGRLGGWERVSSLGEWGRGVELTPASSPVGNRIGSTVMACMGGGGRGLENFCKLRRPSLSKTDDLCGLARLG